MQGFGHARLETLHDIGRLTCLSFVSREAWPCSTSSRTAANLPALQALSGETVNQVNRTVFDLLPSFEDIGMWIFGHAFNSG